MPQLIRPARKVPLPAGAVVRTKAGTSTVRVEVRGKLADCEVSP